MTLVPRLRFAANLGEALSVGTAKTSGVPVGGSCAVSSKRRNDLPGIVYRQARVEDAAEIHELLLRLAPEIPILVDTLEREEALYALIRNCGRSGESWVALDEGERIIGFALVDPELLERHYAEYEILDLRYAGVAPEHRGQGVFAALIARVLARLVPVTVTVSPQNRSNAAARLEKFGFRRISSPGGERVLRWEPGAGG